MLNAAAKAFQQLFSPGFRSVLLKSLALTVSLFFIVWLGVVALFQSLTTFSWDWLNKVITVVGSLGILAGLVFLIAPVSALIASFFLDEIARQVDDVHYPQDNPGREPPLVRTTWVAVKFTLVLILVNLFVLLLVWLPGINMVAFLAGNGYLLGREYFELVATRHISARETGILREAYAGRVFVSGMLIAFIAAIPLVNLLVPLFATAFMVHVYKAARRDQERWEAHNPPNG